MLSQLYIKNIAVISKASIDFTNGLNVFTGETGAGKTILIHAINAVLGERASKDLIRTGESKAEISALFTALGPETLTAFEEAGYEAEADGSILLSREISAEGKTVCRINGRPATVSILRRVSSFLINIHGQHDNQQLLSSQKHLAFIDSYGSLEPEIASYREAYRAWKKAQQELLKLNTDESEKARRMDLLQYQIAEIQEAELEPGEDEELENQRRLLQNSVTVVQALSGSLAVLDGSDDMPGLMDQFRELSDNMQDAAKYMEDAVETEERLSDLYYELEGLSGDIRRLLDNFDCDASRLDEIEERLDLIYNLKKKYGSEIPEILEFCEKAQEELERIETSGERAAFLEKETVRLQKEAQKQAGILTKARQKAADAFVKAVSMELVFLDMPSVRLSVHMEPKELGPDGGDAVELMIAANVGEAEKSLSKIASGGELSRIMLSIKNVMADRDKVGTMIFDEVDTGVSGRAAQKIGEKLAQVAKNRQVIVVTHLAQVAAYAKNHLLISKKTDGQRTFTSITALEREKRVQELARITAGENISELALEHADEMLRDAGN
ncbi:MAG: DNA repair protein RecN [Oscillospiraceae bacterium]|nr:DNA repair protein RecN [Oscillospiraceae bacterium]